MVRKLADNTKIGNVADSKEVHCNLVSLLLQLGERSMEICRTWLFTLHYIAQYMACWKACRIIAQQTEGGSLRFPQVDLLVIQVMGALP